MENEHMKMFDLRNNKKFTLNQQENYVLTINLQIIKY